MSNDVDLMKYRDGLVDDLEGVFERIVSDDSDVQDEAEGELDTFALAVEVRSQVRILLTVGGPTVYLEADVMREGFGWERTSSVMLHHSWSTLESMPVRGVLEEYFDSQLEYLEV